MSAAGVNVQLPGGTQLVVPLSDAEGLRVAMETHWPASMPSIAERIMLSFAANIRIFLGAQADGHAEEFRRPIRASCAGVLQADPLDGSLFLFINRHGDRLKALWWGQDGLALFYKRLESGTFEMLLRPKEGSFRPWNLTRPNWPCS